MASGQQLSRIAFLHRTSSRATRERREWTLAMWPIPAPPVCHLSAALARLRHQTVAYGHHAINPSWTRISRALLRAALSLLLSNVSLQALTTSWRIVGSSGRALCH